MSLKTFAAAASTVALMATMVACSDDSSDEAQSHDGEQSASLNASHPVDAEDGALPTTVQHKFGETTIEEPASRVVSLGYTDQDVLAALNVEPVMVREWNGEAAAGNGFGAWVDDAHRGDEALEIYEDPEINPEKVAAVEPDLIIATYAEIDQDLYDQLSAIAPVIVQSGDFEDYQQPWDATTKEIGQAVGKPQAAEDLVNDINSRFEALKNKHPEWAEKSVDVAYPDQASIMAYASNDPRTRFFTKLGFAADPKIDELAGDEFYVDLSEERLNELTGDILVWQQLSDTDKGDKTAVTEDKTLSTLPAVTEGRSVYLEGDLGTAFAWQTPLALEYVLDNIEEPLEAPLNGDTAAH